MTVSPGNPDSASSTHDVVALAYNAQGQEVWKRDQKTLSGGSYTDYNLILTRADLPSRMLSTSHPMQGQYTARIPLPPLFGGVSITRGVAICTLRGYISARLCVPGSAAAEYGMKVCPARD